MQENVPDYMNINLRPDLNPQIVEENCEGEKLTLEESLFVYYLVAGLSRVEAFIKAGFTTERKPVGAAERRDKKNTADKTVENIIHKLDAMEEANNTSLDTKEPTEEMKETKIPGSGELEEKDYHINLPQVRTLDDIQNITKEERGYLLASSRDLSRVPRIATEYSNRLSNIRSAQTADAQEVYAYFTAVMRGQVKDQFGLEASLQERTRAAEALAKRLIDMPAKLRAATAWAEKGAVTINIQPRVEEVIDVTSSGT